MRLLSVGFGSIALKNPIADRLGVLPLIAFVAVDEARGALDGHDWRLNGDQLGQFPQVSMNVETGPHIFTQKGV